MGLPCLVETDALHLPASARSGGPLLHRIRWFVHVARRVTCENTIVMLGPMYGANGCSVCWVGGTAHTYARLLQQRTSAHAARCACGVSTAQDHSGGPDIIEANEQVACPPLPRDRHPSTGHPLPDLPAHRRVPARHPYRGPDRALTAAPILKHSTSRQR
jgi:hypothetical protein